MDGPKRIEAACIECRRRKRKCDGSKPRCSSCLTQGRECSYTDDRHNRKRRRDPEEVAQLEEQVQFLMQRVRELENDISSAKLPPSFQPNQSEWSQAASRPREAADEVSNETRLSSAVDEVGSLMWKLRIGNNGDTSFVGPSSNFHFISAAQEPSSYGQPQHCQDIAPAGLLPLQICLTDRVLQQDLLEIFQTVINPENQFVESSFFRNPFDYSIETRQDRILLQSSILALSACFSTLEDANKVGNTFSHHAESLVQQCCRTSPSLMVVQALAILCWRDLTLDNDNMAWMYNCMAGGLATHLGLHVVALQNVAGISPSDKESRIRTFWQGFRVDRIATFSLGRQCVIPWARVSTPPLESILTPSAKLADLAFSFECQLLFIFDKYMDQIYSFQFSGLDSHIRHGLLTNARDKLVSFYKATDDDLSRHKDKKSRSIITFRMSYHMCLILVQRPLLRENPSSALYRMAVQSLSASAVSITTLIREYRKAGYLTTAPFFVVHHVLTAAIVHLLSATSSDEALRKRSTNQFRESIEALEEMRSVRKRSRKAIALLQELANRWSVVVALPMRLSYPISDQVQEDNGITNERKNRSPTVNETTAAEPMSQDVNDSSDIGFMDGLPRSDFTLSLPSAEANGADCFSESSLTYGIYEMGDPFELNNLNWLFPSID